MKTRFRVALASMVVAAGISATAGAANFTNCADRLKDVGLFQGTTQGYELDRAPTRAEASAMLVRLLGKEAEAQKLEYTAPFTDLKGWEKPYVQYLYNNGLANGTSATTYNPSGKCSAQMYTTFLLRALGYSDTKGDFTYADALNFGESVGLVDYSNVSGTTFLRDNVAAMSLTALDTQVNGGGYELLLEKLMNDGAVDKTKADDLYTFFMQSDAFAVASENTAADTKTAMDMAISADISVDGATAMSLSMPMSVKTDMNLKDMDKSVMEMTGKMTLKLDPSLGLGEDGNLTQDIKYYYTNGTYYMDMGESGKYKMAMSFDDILNGTDLTSLNNSVPISAIDSITEANGTMTVKYSMNGLFDSDLFNNLIGGMLEGVSIDIKDMNVAATVTNGKISGTDMSGTVTITSDGTTMSATLKASAKVTATGNSVKITLPTDLNIYEEMKIEE